MKFLIQWLFMFIAVFFLAALASAESVTLSNAECSRVFVALRSMPGGLSAINTRNAALDINALRPVVESMEAGQRVVGQKMAKLSPTDPQREARVEAINQELMALIQAKNTVNLTLFALTDDEIRDAKVSADALSELMRFLAPGTQATKK